VLLPSRGRVDCSIVVSMCVLGPGLALGPLFFCWAPYSAIFSKTFSQRRESDIERLPSIFLPRLDGAHGRTDGDSGYGGAAGVLFFCVVRFLQCGYAEKCKAWRTTNFPAVRHTVGTRCWCAHAHLMRRPPRPLGVAAS
jgi:hypothetical protein